MSLPAVNAYYRSYNGFNDELVWGALWLYRATGFNSYLVDAKSKYQQFGGGNTPKMFSWDDKRAGSQVNVNQIIPIVIIKANLKYTQSPALIIWFKHTITKCNNLQIEHNIHLILSPNKPITEFAHGGQNDFKRLGTTVKLL